MIVDGVIVHELVVAQPLERVWRALTDPAELATWLMPNNFVPSVGARFEFDARPTFDRFDCEVLDLDEPRRMVWRWSGGPIRDSVVEFTLEQVEGGTRLRLEHRGFVESQADARGEFDHGWGTAKLPGLVTLLDGTRTERDSTRGSDGLWRHPAA